jgi:hypothetical protein
MVASSYASLARTPKPRATVECGSCSKPTTAAPTNARTRSRPSTICGGTVTKGIGPVREVAFNALHNRLGIAMPNTQQYTETHRPQGTNNLFVAWETLTHANNPA